ncbi:MAG: response regulator [bacterium]
MTILIIDDQREVLEMYQEVLVEQLGHHVESVSMPREAMHLVERQLFDVVIVDAKIMYKGAPFGGLLLAEEISTVVGIGSIILMSQFDMREEVRRFDAAFTFLSKPRDGSDLLGWVKKDLSSKICNMVAKQYGFVAMSFGNAQNNEWYRTRLAPWMKEAGFDVKRMDEFAHREAINVALLGRIKEAHFVVFYASLNNANVFFEAGYAYAQGKYLVVLSPKGEELPFDLRSNYAITIDYEDDARTKADLMRLMYRLRGLPCPQGDDHA